MIDYEDYRINGAEIDLIAVYDDVTNHLDNPPLKNAGGLAYLKLVMRLAPTGVHSSQAAAIAIATAFDISWREG